MGEFVTPAEVKARVQANVIQEMENPDLDDMWIMPTEKRVEIEYNLNLDTNGIPWHWRGIFDTRTELEADYRNDYKRSVILVINRMSQNPFGYRTQTVGGASVIYGSDLPPEVDAIMQKWGKGSSMQGKVFR
jgi:hypothetical protein